MPEGNGRLEKQGRFSLKDFSYDGAADAYRCPAGELLHPMKGRLQNTSGRVEIRYASRKTICDTCQLRVRCLSPKATHTYHRVAGSTKTFSNVIARGCKAQTN